MARGKTFNLGDFMVNVSDKGIATKNMTTGEIRRYKYPWVTLSEKLAERNADPADAETAADTEGAEYDDGYDSEYDSEYDAEYSEPEYSDDGGEYYDDDDYEDDEQQEESLLDNPILMWIALVVLPPLGIWLLWRNNRYEIVTRSAISAASLIWFIILLFWLFSWFNRGDDTTQLPPVGTATPTATVSATPTASPTPTAIPQNIATPTPSTQPSATPNTGNMGNTNTNLPTATDAPEWVWSKEGGTWYHKDQSCTNMSGATRVTLAVALNRRQTACPTCFPTETTTKATATPLPSGTYYSTPNGDNYHVLPNCRGMSSAQVVTLAEALARNQTPCETCIGTVYMTEGGDNYHTVSNCRGMKNAFLTTIEKAVEAGKTPCETCIGGSTVGNTGTTNTGTNNGETVYYYNPNGGKYYHLTDNCTGMKNAIKGTAAAAENNGLAPCPTCLDGVSTNAKYWATTNGDNYHLVSNCRGMKNAVRITEATAIARGKTPCTTCIGTTTGGDVVQVTPGSTGNTVTVPSTTTKYYSTADGENFHSNQTCRGMKGATEVTAEQIIERGQTACPKCIGTSGTYYSTENGDNYHSDPECRGMKGATIVTLAMINARNQTPCTKCIGTTGDDDDNTISSNVTYYWATANGTHYHSKSNCTGMKGATKITEDDAEDRGQTPCPTCVGSVYGTADGTWYHKDKSCTGMKNAVHMTILDAEKSGKTACPTCIGGGTTAPTVTPKPGEDDEDGSLYYYSREGGTYYHREDDCTGMKNPDKVSEATAIARGQKPCPDCIGSVYATERGDHYHSDPNCDGMKGASLVTIDTAELRGQSPCPKCLDGDSEAPNTEKVTVNTTVYCTLTGRYYHSYQYCQDMKHAGPVTLGWALDPAYEPCTKCGAPKASEVDDPDEYMVYCTLGGQNYHTKKNCSGMRSAADVPLSWALDPGFRPCKECDPPEL